MEANEIKTQNMLWDVNQLRKYNLTFSQIPRLSHGDPRVDEFISQNKPVVITGSEFVKSASRWNLDFLEENLADTNCTVVVSRNHKFKYFDSRKMVSGFKPTTKRVCYTISDFAKKLRNWKKGEERVYLQQMLNNTVRSGLVEDFINFRWDWINEIGKKHSWGPLSYNLLLVGMEGNVTPCHYDEQQNMFAQIRGFKRFILFPPEQFECFYPYPVFHPCDRQSQVDFEKPDFTRFPKFVEALGQEAVVGPGDVIFIPIFWWHHVESLMRGDYTVSLNFWYTAAPPGPLTYPLPGSQKVSIMRNVEKMLMDALQDPNEVAHVLQVIVSGRYDGH